MATIILQIDDYEVWRENLPLYSIARDRRRRRPWLQRKKALKRPHKRGQGPVR